MNIHSPRQLVAAIPHLLGFQPQESCVIVAFDQENIEAIVRCDWQNVSASDVASLNAEIRKAHNPSVVVIAYRNEIVERHELDHVLDVIEECSLLDLLMVSNGTWRSLMCEDSDCCPATGHALEDMVDEIAVDFVLAGSAPFTSRESLEISIASRALSADEAHERDLAFDVSADQEQCDVSQEVLPWLTSAIFGHKYLTWSDMAKLCQHVQDFHYRDAVLRTLYDLPEKRLAARAQLIDLVGRAPKQFVPVLATVLAGCAWLDGNGAITRMAIDRALEADSDYGLARLLDRALTFGVPPRVWAESLAAVSMDDCLAGAA